MAVNECIPLFTGAEQITCRAEGAITGKRLVAVNGIRVEGLVDVKPPSAGLAVLGVAAHDAADEAILGVWIGLGIYPMVAGVGGVTAAGVVMPNAAGGVVAFAISATNVPAGIALDTSADTVEAMVLFRPHLVSDTIV